MKLKDIISKAKEVQELYDSLNTDAGQNVWGTREYVQGLTGDVGDLTKLTMMRDALRPSTYSDLDDRITHEVCDCLWSVLLIADSLDIDLEKEFNKEMETLKERIIKEKH